jgi:hypothetical protein
MIEYALQFYNNYTIIFYCILLVAVIFEWPIIILTLSLLAPKFWFTFIFICVFSLLWEFWGDLLHYFIWRVFKRNIFSDKNFSIFSKIEKKLENHSLMDKLIVIKYTPPITSIGLIYLWFQKTDFRSFVKNWFILAVFNAIIITSIWYNFWLLIKDKNDFEYLIMWLMLTFLIFYMLVKITSSYLIKKILNERK